MKRLIYVICSIIMADFLGDTTFWMTFTGSRVRYWSLAPKMTMWSGPKQVCRLQSI